MIFSNYIDECYDQLIQNIAQLNIATKKDEMIIGYNDKSALFKVIKQIKKLYQKQNAFRIIQKY